MKRNLIILTILIAVLVLGTVMMKQKSSEANNFAVSDLKIVEQKNAPQLKKVESHARSEEETPVNELEELPTINDLRALSEDEVHHTPSIVIEGGRIIGRMIEKAENNPALREKTVHTLHECAESDEVATSIRAVCWNNTLSLIEKWKVFIPVSQSKIPQRVLELSSKLQ